MQKQRVDKGSNEAHWQSTIHDSSSFSPIFISPFPFLLLPWCLRFVCLAIRLPNCIALLTKPQHRGLSPSNLAASLKIILSPTPEARDKSAI